MSETDLQLLLQRHFDDDDRRFEALEQEQHDHGKAIHKIDKKQTVTNILVGLSVAQGMLKWVGPSVMAWLFRK